MHCALIQAGEIQAVVGDASRDGVGGRQYCGLWSLTSKYRPFNAFGNSYAGLLPGPLRGKSPTLQVVDETTCVLSREADGVYPADVCSEYTVREPCYVDHSLSFVDTKDTRRAGCGFREVSWCCYMNCPEDPRLHFISGRQWHHYISPAHGVASNIAPSYLAESELEDWPIKSDWRKERRNDRPFSWDRYERRFDQPFYYGRLGEMAMILVFDTPRWLRFYCSPSGGGSSLVPGRKCPAWDFEWVIPEADYEVGKEYSLRVRLIYKRFVSADDVLAEYRRSQAELGFERPPDG
jgi:hypothetical protein